MESPELCIERLLNGIRPYLKKEIGEGVLKKVKESIVSKMDLFEEAASLNTDDLFYLIRNRDIVTAHHSIRVASLCQKMSEEPIPHVIDSAFVHDIGKIFIDRLHEREDVEHIKLIKYGHAIAGFLLCDYRKEIGNGFAAVIENAIKYHHVNGNGDSYPVNYKAHDCISRIVQLADVIDAMKNRGIYQKRFSDDEIIDVLVSKGYRREVVERVLR